MNSELESVIDSRIRLLSSIVRKTENSLESDQNCLVKISCGLKQPQVYIKDCSEESDGKYHYSPVKERKKVRRLIQRDYESQMHHAARLELEFWKKIKEKLPERTIEDIYEQLHPLRQKLIHPLILPDDLFIRQWQEREFHRREFYEEEKRYPTERGEVVRSKSEVMIANELFKAGVPYHYEVPVKLGGRQMYPAFLVLNRRTRKEFYWEHLGRLDAIGYVENSLNKLAAYAEEGYLPGEGLLVTYEGAGVRFSATEIQRVIDCFLK